MEFRVGNETVDSVELKCLVVSRGLMIDKEVYKKCGRDYRLQAVACRRTSGAPVQRGGRDSGRTAAGNRFL